MYLNKKLSVNLHFITPGWTLTYNVFKQGNLEEFAVEIGVEH